MRIRGSKRPAAGADATTGARGSGDRLQVFRDHLRYQPLERVAGLPPQDAARLRRVADEEVHLGRAVEALVLDDVLAPVEPYRGERQLADLADGVRLARGDDEFVRLTLLQHQAHRPDVILRVPPVPF